MRKDKITEKEKIKVYIGRSSLCYADDINAPNPAVFYLPDSMDELIVLLNRTLPFAGWHCYKGKYDTHVKGAEDGIIVWEKAEEHSLISFIAEGQGNECKSIVKYDRDWYRQIREYPYLYFE